MRQYRGSDNPGIVRFVLRALAVVALPLAVAVGIYVALDPYDVMRGNGMRLMTHRDPDMPYLTANKGLVSVMSLEKRIAGGDTPDSFIFGASISCYYEVDYWMTLIDTDVTPLHLDSASEGARSLRLKLEYLRRMGIPVRNALIVLDPLTISSPLVGDDLMSIDHPHVAGRHTWLRWHYRYMSAFCDPDFLVSYLPARFAGSRHKYGHREIFERQPMVYDEYRNEESLPAWDADIRLHPELFYGYRRFPAGRVPHCADSCRVDAEREREYRLISSLLAGSDYHVVVTPMLDCDTLSRRDTELLCEIFGHDRCHNFTSSMAYVALADSNWYDTRHYRAPVAREVMDRIYRAGH